MGECADPWQEKWVLTTGGSAIQTADVTHNSVYPTKPRTSSPVPGSCSFPHPRMLWEFSGISTYAETGQSVSLPITCCATWHQNPQWEHYNIKCVQGSDTCPTVRLHTMHVSWKSKWTRLSAIKMYFDSHHSSLMYRGQLKFNAPSCSNKAQM